MHLAYSANAYMRYPLDEAIRRIADLGYRGIELMADTPHCWPEDMTAADADRIRGLLDRHGLTISNINAFMLNRIGDPRQPYWYPSWIEPDRGYRQIRIDHTICSLTLARRLGAGHVSTEPGGPVSTPNLASASQTSEARAAAMETFVEMLKPVLDHAAGQEVTLLVEPEPGLLIETCEQYLELRARLDSPWLALNCDVGHFYCVGQSPPDVIRRLARDIRHVHIEDIAATRVHQHLVPGDGVIDFAGVFGSLKEVNYDGWVTVELYPFLDDPDAAGRRARECLLRAQDGAEGQRS